MTTLYEDFVRREIPDGSPWTIRDGDSWSVVITAKNHPHGASAFTVTTGAKAYAERLVLKKEEMEGHMAEPSLSQMRELLFEHVVFLRAGIKTMEEREREDRFHTQDEKVATRMLAVLVASLSSPFVRSDSVKK